MPAKQTKRACGKAAPAPQPADDPGQHRLVEELRRQILDKQVVCIVGAGISIGATRGAQAASWLGLLKHGADWCMQTVQPRPSKEWKHSVDVEIKSREIDLLLSAAEKISAKLRAPKGGEFRSWLEHSVGALKAEDPVVIQALASLGVPIATTNYDGLLEEVTGLPPISARDHSDVEKFLRGERQGILHLHGFWKHPETLVLGIRSYDQELANEHAQAMLRATTAMKTLLFVGFGGGLDDPNFGALMAWCARAFQESTYRRYRLAKEDEVQAIEQANDPRNRVFVVRYGSRHEDLGPFLLHVAAAAPQALAAQGTATAPKAKSGEPSRPSDADKSESLRLHRERIATKYLYTDHRGVSGARRRDETTSLRMDDVYVVPRLVFDAETAKRRDRESELLHMLSDEDLAAAERTRLEEEYALLTGERWHRGQRRDAPAAGMRLGTALQKHRKFVVIGSPGVGKSALTRFLARLFALGHKEVERQFGWPEEGTPVVLPLAGFADARERQPKLSLRGYLEEQLLAWGGEILRVALVELLERGGAFVLLDGVDEIPDSAKRTAVVREVDAFLETHPALRCVVTSRPYGYIGLAGDIPHFQLPNFSPDEVEEFVRRWQLASERQRHPGAPREDEATAEAERMLDEIRGNPRVAELATNPLMLVIIALIRHDQARLPEQRVRLYDCAVRTLVETWNRLRSLSGFDVGGAQLAPERLIRALSAIAEWTRREKPTGIIHRAELQRKLVEVLTDQEAADEDPEKTAVSYLNAAADRAGLLEERGKDIFAFWHPTFEEFLAAVELSTPTSKAIQRLLPLRDDPRWHEVILLSVGYVGVVQNDKETATEMVRAIATRGNGPLASVLHTHLCLAADCIADDVGVKAAEVNAILRLLSKMVVVLPYTPLTTAFTRVIRTRPQLRLEPDTVNALMTPLEHGGREVREAAVQMVANATVYSETALATCRRLLMGTKEVRLRACAALGVARAGDHRPKVWRHLMMWQSDPLIHEPIRALLRDSSNAICSLTAQLRSKKSTDRRVAAVLLATFGFETELAVGVLCELAISKESALRPSARREILAFLCALGQVDTVAAMLGDDLNERLLIAGMVARQEVATHATSVLLAPLLDSKDPSLRLQAASVEVWQRQDRLYTAELVRPLLRSGELRQRIEAAALLVHTELVDNELLLTMIDSIRLLTVRRERLRVADLLVIGSGMLRHVGESVNAAVASALVELLSSTEPELRVSAAEMLHGMKCENERVATVARMALGRRSAHRGRAGWLLYQLGHRDERVIGAILTYCTTHQIEEIARDEMVDGAALAALATSNLHNKDHFVRFRAIHALHVLGRGAEQALRSAESMLESDRPHERVWAAGALKDMGVCNRRVVAALLSVIDGDVVDETGYDHGARRMLLELLQSSTAMSIVVEVTLPESSGAMKCFCRAIDGGDVMDSDAVCIDGLVRVGVSDRDSRRVVREWLFVALWKARGGVEHSAILGGIPS